MKGSKTLYSLETRRKATPKSEGKYTFHKPGSRNMKKGYKGKGVSKH